MDSSGVFGPYLLCVVGQPYGERSLHRKTCETISWLASVFHLAVTRFGAKEAKTVSVTISASLIAAKLLQNYFNWTYARHRGKRAAAGRPLGVKSQGGWQRSPAALLGPGRTNRLARNTCRSWTARGASER